MTEAGRVDSGSAWRANRRINDTFGRLVAMVGAAACTGLLYAAVQGSASRAVFVGGLMAFALWNPAGSVLLTVALSPVANYILAGFGAMRGNWAETLVLATGAGVLLRRAFSAERWQPGPAAIAAAVLAATVIASAIVQLAVVRAQVSPELFGRTIAQALASYQVDPGDPQNIVRSAARLLEGLLLFCVIGGSPHVRDIPLGVLRMSVAGAVGAAALNVMRIVAAALRSDAFVPGVATLLRTVRVSAPFTDVNAAGSYFVLALPIAIGLAIDASGWRRAAWGLAASLTAMALWTSGSRAALIAVAVMFAVAIAVRPSRARVVRFAVPGLALVVLLLTWFPNPFLGQAAVGAVTMRAELARTAFRLLSLEPVFGIGIGQFYMRSGEFIRDPQVLADYGRENAHNNYLQILAELGIVGFAAFAGLLWFAGRNVATRLRAGASPPIVGAAFGIGAFLVTCLAGHPLLVTDVALAFWAVLAVFSIAQLSQHASRQYMLAAAAVLAIAMTVPLRAVQAANQTDLEHRGYGVSGWRFDADGIRYRHMSPEATLFVSRDAAVVELPYRLESPGPPVTLDVAFRGKAADRLIVTDTAWHTYRFMRGRRSDDARFLPLSLKVVDGDASRVLLGKITVRQ